MRGRRWITATVTLAPVALAATVAFATTVAATIAFAAPVAVAAGAPFADGAARAQDGDLYDPALVRAYAFDFEARDWETALTAAGDTGNVPARLEVDGRIAERAGVRYKGLSSMMVQSRKKPLNVSVDAFVPGQRMLGYDVVNLNNGYSDPSFVRESLITESLRPFMPTQQTAYARVSVNGQYLGVYLAVEQVEGTFLSTWFPGSDGILIKADPQAGPGMGATTFHSALEWEGEDLAAYRRLYEVKTDGLETAGLTAIREAARILDAPVSAGGVADPDLPSAAARMLDVDRALWYLAATNLFVNYDSYYFGHNYFLYLSEEDGLLHMLMWDTSLSFGELNLGDWGTGGGTATRVDPLAMQRADARPVLRRLLGVSEWRADYLAHYRALLDEAFDPDALEARGAALQALARPHLASDPNRLFSMDLFDRNLRDDVTPRANMGPGGKAPGVVKFARERAAWLARRPELAVPDHRLVDHVRAPDAPRPDQAATVTLRFAGGDTPIGVRLVYRVNRGVPMSLELTPDGDAWRGEIPGHAAGAEITYYARVSLPAGRSAFHPTANLTQPWSYTVRGPDLPLAPRSDLVINELMADNEATLADEAGEYDDWLELYNRGIAPVELGSYFLGPSADAPWRYRLPDVTLEPGAFFLVWCDKDPEQGPDHAPFKLAKAGDEVRLSSRDATLDVVAFGAQATDASHARVPDGGEKWWTCDSPTPGRLNRCGGLPAPTVTSTPAPTSTSTVHPTSTSTVHPTATSTGHPTATATGDMTAGPGSTSSMDVTPTPSVSATPGGIPFDHYAAYLPRVSRR